MKLTGLPQHQRDVFLPFLQASFSLPCTRPPPPRKKMTSEQATTAAKLKSATGAAWAAVIGGTVHGLLELPVGVSEKC